MTVVFLRYFIPVLFKKEVCLRCWIRVCESCHTVLVSWQVGIVAGSTLGWWVSFLGVVQAQSAVPTLAVFGRCPGHPHHRCATTGQGLPRALTPAIPLL